MTARGTYVCVGGCRLQVIHTRCFKAHSGLLCRSLAPAQPPGCVSLSAPRVGRPVLDNCPGSRGRVGRLSPSWPLTTPLSVPSCVSFSIYVSWGERCEHLSMKLGAFFGILFGSLGALLALGAVAWVALRLWDPSKNECSYPLPSEH